MSGHAMGIRNTCIGLVVSLMLVTSCQKELSITEFRDDYSAYKTELRIEAILNAVDPMQSIVRVDRTILVTDTTIFNGRDDDGDWYAPTDDTGEDGVFADGSPGSEKDAGEGNGVPDPGEPHVDEYDEIISQLHDSTLTIQLYDLAAESLLMEFTYVTQADSFEYSWATSDGLVFSNDDLTTEVIYYGGYRPIAFEGEIEYGKEYEFRMDTGNSLITGTTIPLPPAEYQQDDHKWDGDTLLVKLDSRFRWITDRQATVTWVSVERIFEPDSIIMVTSHPAGPTDQTDDGKWIGEDIIGLYVPGLYRWTVAVPSRAYGAYIYSNLPMRDEKLSNLSYDDGQVVLGIAGSSSPAIQYVRIVE